jgi:hypothetical protein
MPKEMYQFNGILLSILLVGYLIAITLIVRDPD